MTKKDIDNIISIICPNDEDFEKPIISPAYLKKELEVLALEQEPCEDVISRAYIEPIIEELENIYVNGDEHILNLLADIKNAPSVTPHITPTVLADALFEKDIIRDVKCRLPVSIIDHRPCYCGAELREVWRESEE